MYCATSRVLRIQLAIGLLLHVLIGLPSACQAAGAAPVVVVTAEVRQLTPLIQVPGTVISRNDTRLAAQVEGQVLWVADVGTQLVAGDVAAQLDDVLIRDVLVEEQARVLREQANVTFHQAESKRLARLAKENHAAQSRLDQARRDLSVARSELAAAQSRVKQAREKMQRAAIKAPFSGVVSEQYIQKGEWAAPGIAIVRVVNTETLEVQAWLPAIALPFVHQHTVLGLTIAGQAAKGTVRTLVPVGDDQSHLYELRLTLSGNHWSSGQSARIAVPAAESKSVTVIPVDALVLRRNGTSVFRILEDDTAERVSVTTGMVEGDHIEVIGTILPGDRVVIRGGERLRTGQAVMASTQVSGE